MKTEYKANDPGSQKVVHLELHNFYGVSERQIQELIKKGFVPGVKTWIKSGTWGVKVYHPEDNRHTINFKQENFTVLGESEGIVYQANPIPKSIDAVKLKVIKDPYKGTHAEGLYGNAPFPIGSITWGYKKQWISGDSCIFIEDNRHLINFNKSSFEEIKEDTKEEDVYKAVSPESCGFRSEDVTWLTSNIDYTFNKRSLPKNFIKGSLTWCDKRRWEGPSYPDIENDRHFVTFERKHFTVVESKVLPLVKNNSFTNEVPEDLSEKLAENWGKPLKEVKETYVARSYEERGFTKDQIIELICVKDPHWRNLESRSNVPSNLVKGSITWVDKERWDKYSANIEDNRHCVTFDKSCFKELISDMKKDSESESKTYVMNPIPDYSPAVKLICVNTPTISSGGRSINNSPIRKGDVTWVSTSDFDEKSISHHLEDNRYMKNFKREDFKLFVPKGGGFTAKYDGATSLSATPIYGGVSGTGIREQIVGVDNNFNTFDVPALKNRIAELTSKESYPLTPKESSYHPDFSKMNDINI